MIRSELPISRFLIENLIAWQLKVPKLFPSMSIAGFLMNILEIILYMALSAIVGLVGNYLAKQWGPSGWLVLLPVAYLWLRLISGTIKSTFVQRKELSRSRPPCRQGKCQSKDYTLVDPRPSNTVFRCRCGDLYLSQGTYFSQIIGSTGSVEPYMVMDRAGEWKPDVWEPSSARI